MSGNLGLAGSASEEDGDFFSLDQLLAACQDSGVPIATVKEVISPEDHDGQTTSFATGKVPQPLLGMTEEENPAASSDTEGTDRTEEYEPETPKPKGRLHQKRQINFNKRMHGEPYIGYSVTETAKKRRTTPQNIPRGCRKIGPTCVSRLCLRRASRKCSQFSSEDRKNLFEQFWKMSWEEKRAYVLSLVDQRQPIKRTNKDTEVFRKTETYLYYLKLDGVKQQVCRNMFLQTLGMGRRHIAGWLKKRHAAVKKKPRDPAKLKGGDAYFANLFLQDLPKLPSHYCRKDTSKLYLEPLFQTKAQVFKVYSEVCKESSKEPISSGSFYRLFDEKSFAIHQPKKDQCDVCFSKKSGNVTEDKYTAHIAAKNAAREAKVADKELSLQGKCHVITMDVQRVLLAPCLNASALYYKTKLVVHNFTLYDMSSRQAKCFLWDETEAGLVASVFASCLVRYLTEHFTDDLPIVIWSDGCTNQNRNAALSNALSHYAVKKSKLVTQKYLEKGHTQMEVDSVHANIEKKLKNREIYLPTDYVNVCKNAREKNGSYEVQYLNHTEFIDYSRPKSMRYPNIRPGNKTGDPQVTDLKEIRYNIDGTIDYKLSHSGDWTRLPRMPKQSVETTFPKLYNTRIPLTQRKYQDLMDLLHVIPKDMHQFYISLPKK